MQFGAIYFTLIANNNITDKEIWEQQETGCLRK